MSNFSSSRPPPTIFNPGSFFQSVNTFKSSTVGVNPHRFLQRPRSNSTVSSFFSAFSEYSASGDEYDDDLDSIDGMTDEEEIEEETEEETEEEEHVQVVARVKHGTIMNGKGEFVNKSKNDHWLDESRANRKIADLEIENQTLLSLNASLEYKVKQQAEYINELEKRLQQVEVPLTPISDKHVDDENESLYSYQSFEEDEEENDRIFQRVKSALETLIEQAEVALIEKQETLEREETLRKLTMASDIERSGRPVSEKRPASVKMSRNLSRQSSPPVMQRAPSLHRSPPLQRSASVQRNSPTLYRSSSALDRPIQRSSSPLQRSSSSLERKRPSSRLSDSSKPKWN